MANDLISPDDMTYLPGAPFTDEEVDAAVAALRGELGWHIAPEQTDTVLLDVASCDPVLRLPTRHLVSVDEIRNVRAETVIAASSYEVSTNLGRVRRYAWPTGYGAVEVDMTHGYESCPAELVPIIGTAIVAGRAAAGGDVKQQTAGPFSVTYTDASMSTGQMDTLERYSIRTSWPARL